MKKKGLGPNMFSLFIISLFLSYTNLVTVNETRSSMKNPNFPNDLIIEILLRLPLRSVVRFKCVCKSWLSLISDPQFCISHYDLDAEPSHRLILTSNEASIESIDVDTPLHKDSIAHHFLLFTLSPPQPQHTHFQFSPFQPKIFGSCRGLILLYYEKNRDLVLWNPSIGLHKQFSDFENALTNVILYGFAYDESTDDYLLILIGFHVLSNDDGKPKIQVFSFKTNSSNVYNINVSFPYVNLGNEFRGGMSFNAALHWLVFSKDKKGRVIRVILAFDLIQRSFSEIPIFDHIVENSEVFSLRVMRGCLSVCVSIRFGLICPVRGCTVTKIWIMKEYKVQTSWTKSFVSPNEGRFFPICFTKDGGILGSNVQGLLKKLNGKGELLDKLCCDQDQNLYDSSLLGIMYRESIVTPQSPVTLGLTR